MERKRFSARVNTAVVVERKLERSAPLNKLRSRSNRASSWSWDRGAASLKAGVESSQRSPREESVASSLLAGSIGDLDRRRYAATGETLRGQRQSPRGYILEGHESWVRSVGLGLVRDRISGREEWSQERRSGGRSGATQGPRLRRSSASYRRIRYLSEDPVCADDTVCLLRRLGVLLADIYHPCAGETLVSRARIGKPHGWGKVRYFPSLSFFAFSEDEKPYINYF